jgi:hypothetical protein
MADRQHCDIFNTSAQQNKSTVGNNNNIKRTAA